VSAVALEALPGWEALELRGAPQTVELIVAAPEGAHPGFRPNLVLTAGAPSLEQQAEALRSFHVVDRTAAELAGRPCVRTLGHHEVGGRAVVVEEWRLSGPEGPHELTASCGALDYPGLADAFMASVASLRLGAG